MKKKYYVLLLVFLGACSLREQSDIQKEVLASTEVISISADSLVRSFAKDSSAATVLYKDKVLSVRGEVLLFENMDTIDVQVNDTLPSLVKWFIGRLESDFNASNIIFRSSALSAQSLPYTLNATFPKEYRKELKGVKEKSKVVTKGKLEYVSRVYQKNADSTQRTIGYVISLQGCVLEK